MANKSEEKYQQAQLCETIEATEKYNVASIVISEVSASAVVDLFSWG